MGSLSWSTEMNGSMNWSIENKSQFIGMRNIPKHQQSTECLRGLRSKIDHFDISLEAMENQSRELRDFYSDISEGCGVRMASLAKRHTRHLIPPQHTPSRNGKLLLETSHTINKRTPYSDTNAHQKSGDAQAQSCFMTSYFRPSRGDL